MSGRMPRGIAVEKVKTDSLNLSVNTVVGSVLGRCYLLSRLRQEIF